MPKIPTDSKFPLLIIYSDGMRQRVDKPSEIESGRAFTVLETNYDRTDLKSYAQVEWEEDTALGRLDD